MLPEVILDLASISALNKSALLIGRARKPLGYLQTDHGSWSRPCPLKFCRLFTNYFAVRIPVPSLYFSLICVDQFQNGFAIFSRYFSHTAIATKVEVNFWKFFLLENTLSIVERSSTINRFMWLNPRSPISTGQVNTCPNSNCFQPLGVKYSVIKMGLPILLTNSILAL